MYGCYSHFREHAWTRVSLRGEASKKFRLQTCLGYQEADTQRNQKTGKGYVTIDMARAGRRLTATAKVAIHMTQQLF